MQNCYKVILTVFISFCALTIVCAQEDLKFKDVLLDGKPAKLNVATGEITLVTLKEKSVETKVDSVKIKPILGTNSQIIKASSPPKVLAADSTDFHIVKEGDNLFKLSVKYQSSLTELKKANNLETTLIQKGQKLRVRNFDKVSDNVTFRIVKKGDNLYRIAKEAGTTVSRIKSLNGLTSDTIYIGQKLQLNKKD